MRKVRIISLPKHQQGGQPAYYNKEVFNQYLQPDKMAMPNPEVKSTLRPVSREDANLEAEKGEVAITDIDDTGIPSSFKIGGKRHYDGGTPLDLKDNSYIFSRDKGMKIKDMALLKSFGVTKPMVPSDIAKKYDLNPFKKILGDKNADKRQIETAEKMIENYNLKLGKLALAQESIKGFPQGVPLISQPYVQAMKINPEMFIKPIEENMQMPVAKQGGEMGMKKVRIVKMPMAQLGYDVKPYPITVWTQSPEIEQKIDQQYEMNPFVGSKIFNKVQFSNNPNVIDAGIEDIENIDLDWYDLPSHFKKKASVDLLKAKSLTLKGTQLLNEAYKEKEKIKNNALDIGKKDFAKQAEARLRLEMALQSAEKAYNDNPNSYFLNDISEIKSLIGQSQKPTFLTRLTGIPLGIGYDNSDIEKANALSNKYLQKKPVIKKATSFIDSDNWQEGFFKKPIVAKAKVSSAPSSYTAKQEQGIQAVLQANPGATRAEVIQALKEAKKL